MILYKFIKNPSVIFLFQKNDSSLYKGAFDRQPQGLSLRFNIKFNLIAPESNFIFVSLFGGSKPPPYRVGYKFTFMDNRILLLFCDIPHFVRRDIFACGKSDIATSSQ